MKDEDFLLIPIFKFFASFVRNFLALLDLYFHYNEYFIILKN